ncbi:MAG: inorganic phosphate transporter, partial [Muribaculaceae bacterium]|nr:inorganic phosphate transporter [Muribaculaceae bacterium]
GMPTSTTVSMVFELLGATFVVSLIKMASDTSGLEFNDLLNTEKALSVIIGIFLSVAIAFVFGTVVQFVSRTIFSFDYRSRLKWKAGIFGGICLTAIIYFLLIKGVKDLVFMTPDVKAWIAGHTAMILLVCLVSTTCLMQLLHWLGVNVLKVIVLTGTFALAVAFAGNDLVNFIGVPLSGLSAFGDYSANGGGDARGYLMGSLNGPSDTSVWFLIGAGLIMVVALATSKKAQKVSQTEIGLGSQSGGDEMFGSSRIARRLVRWSLTFVAWVHRVTPARVRRWFGRRFNADDTVLEDGAAFDLVRGSVNLVLAGALIALGTSMKLPLSTTFVTFMVAMGTSLADRAWGRESAVFRITGVISVIGGWFLTAGVAFIGAGIIVFLMHLGGHWAMYAMAVVTIVLIVRSNRRFRNRKADDAGDTLFQTILATSDKAQIWTLLQSYIIEQQQKFIGFAADCYQAGSAAFANDDDRTLRKLDSALYKQKGVLKITRRKETLCLRRLNHETAIEKSAWFHLANNCCMSMLYNLRRINEVCKEHVENNFRPLPPQYHKDYATVAGRVATLFADTLEVTALVGRDGATDADAASAAVDALRRRCDQAKDLISRLFRELHGDLREGDAGSMTVVYVYLNMLQETSELISALRKYLRAVLRLTA